MGSFLAKGGRVSGKTVDERCPGLRFLDPSLLPGASVSSSVKTDGFCSGAAGPVFCSLSPAFLQCSVVGRRWKCGLRESRLQHVVTQEELVKRDTLPGAMCGGGVVLLLNEPILIVLVLLLEIALCRVALVLGFLASQELIVFAAILGLLLSETGRVGDGSASLIGCTRSSSVVRRLIGVMRCWSALGRLI